VGWDTSLALDSNNHPHISYSDGTDSFVKYARWNGLSWQIEIVGRFSPSGSPLALDSNDRPHMSYHHNNDLKYAHISSKVLIEPSGGQLVVPGQITISVPTNAFTDTIILTYTALQPQFAHPHVEVFFELSAVYANSGLPTQLVPDQTIHVVSHYKQSNTPPYICEECLALFNWTDNSFGWVPEPSSIVDVNNNTVTATLDHFGVYAILCSDCPRTFLPLIIH
jgi:hypothetical protein